MKLLHILMSALVLMFLVGCQGSDEKMIEVALACPLTGDDAALGQGMKRGFEMAIADANASGALGDIKIVAGEFDDRSDPKEAVTVANQIVSDRDIIGIIGHLNSGCSIPASQVYNKRALVMITPASTDPKLTQQGLNNVFRVCGTDDFQGSFNANYTLDTLGLTRVAVVHDKTAYGQGLAQEFNKQFLARGGSVTSFDGIDRGEKDFKALITRIKTDEPQLIFYGGLYAEGGLLTKQMKELGLAVPLMGGDGIFTNEYCRIGGSGSEGDFASMVGMPAEKLPLAKEWVQRYRELYPGEDIQPYDALTYESALLLIEAYKQAGLDREKLTPTVAGITYTGILGETSFSENGDSRNKLVSMNRVKDGRFMHYEHTAPQAVTQ